jgi:hypothetical protein
MSVLSKPYFHLPPAIAGLMASLPSPDDGWTKTQRDAFMTAFGVVLDFCFPVVAAKPKAKSAEVEDAAA